ncbi:hypothetical protein Tco_0179686 [Tanacetum coccineum]
MPDQRILKLEDQINFLLKRSRTTPRTSSTYIPQAYAEAISSNPHLQNLDKPPKQNYFTFQKRARSDLQHQALEPSFEVQVLGYMAAHTKRMERKEARHLITKHVNGISLVKMEKEKNNENKVIDKDVIELGELNAIEHDDVVDMKKEVEDETDDEPVRSMNEELIEELVEMPRSQP